MELHCVHTREGDDNQLRVLGIFYELGSARNLFLSSFEDYLPIISGAHGPSAVSFNESIDFNLAYAGINLTEYWTYPGSLTTPPCTEAVDWFVFMGKATMSQTQFDSLKMAIGWFDEGGNFRPPQPLHGREVIG